MSDTLANILLVIALTSPIWFPIVWRRSGLEDRHQAWFDKRFYGRDDK